MSLGQLEHSGRGGERVVRALVGLEERMPHEGQRHRDPEGMAYHDLEAQHVLLDLLVAIAAGWYGQNRWGPKRAGCS